MIVMFTSQAYSAVRSNNLQSRYPEGRYRLKMSNLCFLQHGCEDAVLITLGVSVQCCQGGQQLPHSRTYTLDNNNKKKNLMEKIGRGLNMKVA